MAKKIQVVMIFEMEPQDDDLDFIREAIEEGDGQAIFESFEGLEFPVKTMLFEDGRFIYSRGDKDYKGWEIKQN